MRGTRTLWKWLSCAAGCVLGASALAQSPNVVISSAYGGGGFNLGTPLNDYVELFNRSSTAVDLTGWSVQIGTSTATWTVIPLSGSIAAGGYYLVAVGTPFSADGNPLPTPDATASPLLDTSALTSPSGRIVVANTTTPFTVACPAGQPGAVDVLGYGSVACFEGTGAAPGGVSGSQMTYRKNNGCTDSDNNAADFEQGWPPNPRNSSTPANPGGVFVNGSASPNPANAGSSTTITTTISSCSGTPPTITSVKGNFTAFGLTATEAFSGGPTNWTYALNVPALQAGGAYTVNVVATDGTTNYNGTVTFSVVGPPPANDLCSLPQILSTFPFTLNVENATATADVDPGTCNTGTAGNRGVWYLFTPATSGTLIINETGTQDIASGVWTVPGSANPGADCASFTSTNGVCNSAELFGIAVTPGNAYYIQIGASSTTAPTVPITGTIDFISTAPANDDCSSAINLNAQSFPYSATIDNRFALNDVDPGTCSTPTVGQQGVWWRYTAAQNGLLTVTETSTQDVVYGVWTVASGVPNPTADCGGFTGANSVQCLSTDTAQTIPVIAGNTYYVQVSNASTTSTPTVAMAVAFDFVGAPANDDCANAITITATTGSPQAFSVDNRGATPDIDPGACNTGTVGNFGVWFKYVATSTGTLIVNETSTQDIASGVWTVPTAGATCPTATGSAVCNSAESFSVAVSADNTYYIQIGTSSTTAPTVPIAGTFSFVPPAVNEDCATATTIVGTGMFSFSNLGALTGAAPFNSVPCPTTASAMNNDVWYRWVAPASGSFSMISRQHPAVAAGRLALYDGGTGAGTCPTTATPIQCQSLGTAVSNNPALPLSAVAGNVYFIQIASTTAGTTGIGVLEIVQNPTPVGACCAGSVCTVASSFSCAASGGTYQGDGSFCTNPTASVSSYSGAGGTIVDGSTTAPGVFSNSIVVSDTFTVDDVEVDIDMNHTFQGDVFISLSNGSRTLVLSHRGRRGMSSTGNASADYVGVYTFSDAGAQSIFDYVVTGSVTPITPGTYKPASVGGVSPGFKKTFNGVPAAGTWTLLVQDEAAGIAGTVASWTLRLKQGAGAACSSNVVCCRGTVCSLVSAASCTAPAGVGVAQSAGASCNGVGNNTAPCCVADFNKDGTRTIDDIFIFLNAWFAPAANPFTKAGGNGADAANIDDIFIFLNVWFAGGCG